MAKRESIFAQDWRDCLEEHYKDVVQRNDTLTEKTLVQVLHDVGYRDDDLRQLKLEATMRTEDLQGDFVPQLELDEAEPTVYEGVAVPTEVPPHEVEVDPDDNFLPEEAVAVEEPVVGEIEAEAEEGPLDDDAPDPDAPQQMSMF
jgi:hypothetical protein